MIGFLLVGVLIALTSFLLIAITLRYLKQKAVLDHPNERSSHTTPILRGGGLPVVAIILIAWIYPFDTQLLAIRSPGLRPPQYVWRSRSWPVSWADDLKSLSPKFRLDSSLGRRNWHRGIAT